MARQRLGMLLLLMFSVQTLVGGVYGGAVLCFGHAHEHAVLAEREACAGHCEHNSDDAPVRLTTSLHDDGCDCSDTRIERIELLQCATENSVEFEYVQVGHERDLAQLTWTHDACSARDPPSWAFDASRSSVILRALSSVRLLI